MNGEEANTFFVAMVDDAMKQFNVFKPHTIGLVSVNITVLF